MEGNINDKVLILAVNLPPNQRRIPRRILVWRWKANQRSKVHKKINDAEASLLRKEDHTCGIWLCLGVTRATGSGYHNHLKAENVWDIDW